MKAVLIAGSPREKGNTEFMLDRCLATMKAEGVEGEVISLRGKTIKGFSCSYQSSYSG